MKQFAFASGLRLSQSPSLLVIFSGDSSGQESKAGLEVR